MSVQRAVQRDYQRVPIHRAFVSPNVPSSVEVVCTLFDLSAQILSTSLST